jgi:hypothetical protein
VDEVAYFHQLYEAFNRRDLPAVIGHLADDVDWPNAWKGGRLQGPDEVAAYWREQWAQIDPTVDPVSVATLPDGRFAVTVRQVVRDLSGTVIGDGEVVHLYCLSNGLVERMDVASAEQ